MSNEQVWALVPVWRTDTQSARRLFGFSQDLGADEIHKAVEQVRHQRHGQAQAPVWLQALAGFAWAQAQPASLRWVSQDNERDVLLSLVQAFDETGSGRVLVFAQAADLLRRLRLRFLVAGLAPHFTANWDQRLSDGSAWQPQVLQQEPEAAAAILSLSTEQSCYDPWQSSATTAEQAGQQAQALCDLWQRGWL